MKFTSILPTPKKPPSNQPVSVIYNDLSFKDPEYQITNTKSIGPQQLYKYSQQSIIVAQEMIIKPNFVPPLNQSNNMKESNELQVESFDVSRALNPNFFKNKSLIQKQCNESEAKSTCPMTPSKAQQKCELRQKVRDCLEWVDKENQTQRVSIFLEDGTQLENQIYYKYRGPIPLKENAKKESLVIKTFRQVKNRFQESNHQYKKKLEIKKQQHRRFKGSPITYDYNGSPIPLKTEKKTTVHESNTPFILSQAVVMTPLIQNIILPSTLNKTRLQKRKAYYIQDQLQKQNQPHPPFQQLIIYENSQFLTKIPKQINNSRMFKNYTYSDCPKQPLTQISFSQFKKKSACLKNLQNCVTELKETKSKMLESSIVGKQMQCKKSLKRAYLKNGKMDTNQEIFERVFNFRPQCKQIFLEQNIMTNEFREIKIPRQTRIDTLDVKKNSKQQKKYNKNSSRLININGRRRCLVFMPNSLKKVVYKSQAKQVKTTLIRNNLKRSTQTASQNT